MEMEKFKMAQGGKLGVTWNSLEYVEIIGGDWLHLKFRV